LERAGPSDVRQGVIDEDEVERGVEVSEIVRLGLHPPPVGGVSGLPKMVDHYLRFSRAIFEDQDA
jgi:hypothetical protein